MTRSSNIPSTIKVVPARYPLRTLGAVVALFVLAIVVQSVAFKRPTLPPRLRKEMAWCMRCRPHLMGRQSVVNTSRFWRVGEKRVKKWLRQK